jgi:hypothetical protein
LLRKGIFRHESAGSMVLGPFSCGRALCETRNIGNEAFFDGEGVRGAMALLGL